MAISSVKRRYTVSKKNPIDTNDPESRNLDAEEIAIFDAARAAVTLLKKTFETWVVIGKAVVAARKRADRMGGGKTFRRILEQQGLSTVVPPATATRLEAIMAALPKVESWRASLTENQSFAWASPSAVFKHCPVFAKERAERRPAMKRRPSKNSVEAALDLVGEYCEGLAADERIELLARLGQLGGNEALTEAFDSGFEEGRVEGRAEAVKEHMKAGDAGDRWHARILTAEDTTELQELLDAAQTAALVAAIDRCRALDEGAKSTASVLLKEAASKRLRRLLKTAKTETGKAWVAEMAKRLGLDAAAPKGKRPARKPSGKVVGIIPGLGPVVAGE
jgi:hypothetical protein